MISVLSINKAVNEILKEIENVKVYSTTVRDQYDRPAFFVQITPVKVEDIKRISSTTISVIIHYFSKEKTHTENLRMFDILRKKFNTTLKVGDRNLTIYDVDFIEQQNVLQYRFVLNVCDEEIIIDNREKMQNLEMRYE